MTEDKLTLKKFIQTLIKLLIPFGLWLFCFRDYFSHKIGLIDDGRIYFNTIKFYVDAILHGQIPFWNPFALWGIPNDINLRFIGEFNPFIYFLTAIYKLGCPYDMAYFIYVCVYYFFGLCGFYCLSLRLYRDRGLAYLAYVLLLFSSVGMPAFFNFCIMLLWVPIIWFFYFVLAFYQSQEKRYFLGIIYSLMIILVTYMPFYFLTVLFFLATVSCISAWPVVVKFYSLTFVFIKNNKRLFFIGLISLLLAALPGLIWFYEGTKKDYVISYRDKGSDLSHTAATTEQAAAAGNFIGPVTWKKLFSNLDKNTDSIAYIFIPFLAYIVLGLSIFTKISRRFIVFFLTAVLIILTAMANVAPLYGFLFKHVIYFKFMRNLFYFVYLALPWIVLSVVEQLRLLFAIDLSSRRQKIVAVLLTLIVHGVIFVFLNDMGNIVPSLYVVLGGSWIISTLYAFGVLSRGWILYFALVMLVIFQGFSILNQFTKNLRWAHPIHYKTIIEHPRFYFERPRGEESMLKPADSIREYSGMGMSKVEGVGWAVALLSNVSNDALQDYVQYKFAVYDAISAMPQGALDWAIVDDFFEHQRDVALVAGLNSDREGESNPGPAIILKHDSDQLQILDFGYNFIKFKTNFPQRKFIVYNDNYYNHWRAEVNGLPVKLYRANVTFKGLWVDSGENVVSMQFGGLGLYGLWWGLILFFMAFAGYLSWEFLRMLFNYRRI